MAGYLTNHGKQLLAERWKELDMAAYAEDTLKATEMPDDYGPAMQAIQELHKRTEQLHMAFERMERKFRPVLRSVPEDPGNRDGSPHPVTSEVTERLGSINGSLAMLEQRITDVLGRCEL